MELNSLPGFFDAHPLLTGFLGIGLLILLFLWRRGSQTASDLRHYQPKNTPRNTAPVRSFPDSQPSTPDIEEDDDSNAGDSKVQDPDFNLSPLAPDHNIKGKVLAKHGDAIYGGDETYDRDDYLGRVSYGADLELMDRRVYRNEFTLDIIKVKVISNKWESEIGRIGWVGLDDTSFRDAYDSAGRFIKD